MSTERSLRTLLIEPDAGCRESFRQVALGSQLANRVHCSHDLNHGLRTCDRLEPFDLVFVSSEFPDYDIREFLKESRKLPATQKAAYLIVAHAQARETWRVASSLINGIDGFLFTPFSVQSFINTAEGAKRGMAEEKAFRERTAITLLVRSIIEQVTDAATLRAAGHQAKITMRMLFEMCSVLKELEPHLMEMYFESLTALTETAPPATKKVAEPILPDIFEEEIQAPSKMKVA